MVEEVVPMRHRGAILSIDAAGLADLTAGYPPLTTREACTALGIERRHYGKAVKALGVKPVAWRKYGASRHPLWSVRAVLRVERWLAQPPRQRGELIAVREDGTGEACTVRQAEALAELTELVARWGTNDTARHLGCYPWQVNEWVSGRRAIGEMWCGFILSPFSGAHVDRAA